MRNRRFFAVSAVILATALLAGCTAGTKAPNTADVAPRVDLCAAAAPAGAVSDGVVVDGQVGSPATVALAGPITVVSTERTVLVEGDGPAIESASLVDYAMTAFDAATGAPVQTQGYDGVRTMPVPASTFALFLGCATVGSRIVVATPETDQEGATVWVLDVRGTEPGVATGDEQEPVTGMPTVELTEDGAPLITVPTDEPPKETEIAVLKKGAGAVVAAGDNVMLHYTGVRWSDGTAFDSSWSKGAPTSLATADAIAGYKTALEGQTVGSQVLAVIPPQFAYGEGTINEDDLTGETLVMVIDILATLPAA